MFDDKEWVIVFFVDEKGYSPIQEFLHGFQKKTQKTPRREIEIALQRLDSFTK